MFHHQMISWMIVVLWFCSPCCYWYAVGYDTSIFEEISYIFWGLIVNIALSNTHTVADTHTPFSEMSCQFLKNNTCRNKFSVIRFSPSYFSKWEWLTFPGTQKEIWAKNSHSFIETVIVKGDRCCWQDNLKIKSFK